MGGLLGGTMPKPPKIKPPPPPANPPTLANPAVSQAGALSAGRSKGAAGGGFGGTVATGPEGLSAPPSTAQVSLLGGTA